MTGEIDASGDLRGSPGGQRALSALIVIVTALLGVACVVMLSCTLTQTRISSIAFSGVNVSVWKLDDIRKQWQALRSQINAQAVIATRAQQDSSAAAVKYSEYGLVYRPSRTTFDAKMGPLISRIRAVDPSLGGVLAPEGPVERLETLRSHRDALAKAHPEIEDGLKEMLELGEDYKKVDALRIKLKSDADSRGEIATAANDALSALQNSLDNLFSAQVGVKPIDAATRVRIENALFELYSDGWLGATINSILVLPPEILTLLLVVLMGVLGSSLQLTHQLFVRKEEESIGVYSLRLCVGAITALVIFIVAKAGVPIIADASRLGGDTPINPYFVSFLAIISGLMSEKAIASVQALGARYFDDGTKETPRWALPALAKAFEASKRSAADLAHALDVSEKILKGWLSGKEQVPLAAQRVIAAVFNMGLRDLFSDIPPDNMPGPEADPAVQAPIPAAATRN
jgi:hypothetical protein